MDLTPLLTPTQPEKSPPQAVAADGHDGGAQPRAQGGSEQAIEAKGVEGSGDVPLEPESFGYIPDLHDATVPKPKVGMHTLSASAIRGRIRRVFTRKINGSAKVSEQIFQEYQAGGQGKKTLEQIFKQCGYDPEACLNWDTGFKIKSV